MNAPLTAEEVADINARRALGYPMSSYMIRDIDALLRDRKAREVQLRSFMDQLDGALAAFGKANIDRDALTARVAEALELLQEAYEYGTVWRGERIYKWITNDAALSQEPQT